MGCFFIRYKAIVEVVLSNKCYSLLVITMITFAKNIFILGSGAIAQCTLPLLLKLIAVAPNKITIMDFVDNTPRIKEFLDRGITYINYQITPENYANVLSQYVKPGDLFIDLAWDVETCAMLEWCHNNNVLYVNTSVEEWDPYQKIEQVSPTQLTLYARHMDIKKLTSRWKTKGSTAIVDHGANPGLVSHFTKQALAEIATKIIQEKPKDSRNNALQKALASNNFAQLALLTGTKVIHISERDSQITNKPKIMNEFVNTWSIEGFLEEGLAPAELGWGTHEKTMPQGALQHTVGPQNQILLASRGMETLVRSWVPSGQIIGMVIRHGEAYSISNHLTVWEDDKAIYRPTVHYAYCPTDSAFNSLYEFRMRNYVPQEKKRILNDEIIAGADELGCLLMGHDFNAWWIGSLLNIEQARALVPNQNCTTLQVAISVVASVIYAINHPTLGVCVPDDLDYQEILAVAKPFLGDFFSKPVSWTPISGPNQFLVFGKHIPKLEDIWQFSTFLVNNNFYTYNDQKNI